MPPKLHAANGFSRKIENHTAAVAINCFYFAYNFIKIHRSLRMSPAMAAGVVDRLFDVSDLVNLLIESEIQKGRVVVTIRLEEWIEPLRGSQLSPRFSSWSSSWP